MLEQGAPPDVEDGDGAAGLERPGLSATRLVPVAVLVLGLALALMFDLHRFLSLDTLRDNSQALVEWTESAGASAWVAFVAGYALVIALSLPGGAVMTVVGGFLFGPLVGSVLAIFGATLGATGLFLAARYAFADFFRDKVGSAVCRMEAGFNENALSYLLFLRLVPMLPFWLINLVPALLGVRLGTYVLATAIGIVPGTVVYAFVGDGLGSVLEGGGEIDLQVVYQPRFLLPMLGLAVLALLPAVYTKLRRR